MLLAFDTSSAACTAALLDVDGACVASRDELIGRGHAERLVPMIEEMLAGRTPSSIVVGLGPGSFTGIRVAIAAAHGLAIGWGVELRGMASLALVAASFGGDSDVAVAVAGGHGELFVQEFSSRAEPISELRNLVPSAAAAATKAKVVVGSGAQQLVTARGWGEAHDAWPSAASALSLPEAERSLPPRPLYARAPDARPREAA
jgi:tRNA threonylcarbamoyl adenosine modification protein YeaZ